MEQLRQLGGRLLGKKRIAVILGLLGLCCPSSLWAEKLDTTFVLDIDMTIDMTPCYYTKYNGSGQIVDYGNYLGDDLENNLFGDYDQSCVNAYYRFLGGGYSRINIGIVTNEEGFPLDTLFYACDRVTKQWREVPSLLKDPQYSYEFYDNGMLRGLYYYGKYRGYQYFDSDEWVTEQVPSWMAYITYSKNGYPSKFLHETYSAGGLYRVKIGVDSHEELNFDTWGNYSIWNSTTYDERHNLIQTVYKNNVCTHAYDSLDRRIKTVNYDAGYNVTDSVIYTYGHPLHEGEPYLLSILVNDNPIKDFVSDKFKYDFPDSITYMNVKYITPYGSTVEQSYNKNTNVMTLIVKGANYNQDSTDVNQYTLTIKSPESYITEMNFDGFSPQIYHYDNFSQYYLRDFYGKKIELVSDSDDNKFIEYEISKHAKSLISYDTETGILTITVKGRDYDIDSTNVHTYTFSTKKINIFHISSIKINGKELEGFSPNKFDYELSPEYVMGENFHIDFDEYPKHVVKSNGRYDILTHTYMIVLRYNWDYYALLLYQLHFQPVIKEFLINDVPFSDFSSNIYEYEVPTRYSRERISCKAEEGVVYEESFDESTNTLTLSVYFSNDSTRITNYTFHFTEGYAYPSLYITTTSESIDDNSILIDDFEYEVIGDYDESSCQCKVLDGKLLKSDFDPQTNIWTIVVTDDFNNNSTYRIHFRPIDGVDDFLGDQVSLYVTDKTICVDGATEPVYVYNFRGALVGISRSEEVRIPVRQAGVYVVKAGGKAAKMVVK